MDLRHPRTFRQGGFRTLLVILALCISSTAVHAAGPTVLFNIPAGDAQKTLQQFYAQSRIEMLYLTDMVRGTKTNAISGNLDASTALAEMLDDTGLEYSFEEDYSFVSITPRVREPMGSAAPIATVAAATLSDSHDQTELAERYFGEPKIEEVVVTGTLIHGVQDIVSPVEFVTKREMKKSAYATVQDALATLPLNFGGGPSEDFSTVGNFARGSAVNLRGLGAGATLVLVNGNRQPYSGTEADFVDLSNIAWSTVDHIEVLPDGASALYGSDAIAGVVNIITRKDLDGAETQLRLGTAPGGGDEKLVGQLFGKKWDTGSFLFSYQFSQRTSLDASSRAYAANADKRSLGGTDHRSTRSNPGNILDSRTFLPSLAIPAGQDGSSLTAAELISSNTNLQNQYSGVELLPDRQSHSLYLTGAKRFDDRVELFVEGRANDRRITQDYIAVDRLLLVPSTNPFSPYKGVSPAIVSYSFLDDLGPRHFNARTQNYSGSFGARADVTESWKMRLSGSYGRETIDFEGHNEIDSAALRAALADSNRETAFNPFGDGSFTNPKTIESIRGTQLVHARSSITSVNFVADGTAFDLPTGPVKLAVGSEWRQEQLTRGAVTQLSFDRSIQSAYAELAIPIVGQHEDVRALPRVELSLAGRFESYSDFGHSTDPKIGLRWTPANFLKLRTSWGTSFKAPKLADVYDLSGNVASLAAFVDPRSSTGSSLVLAVEGNNPDLTQETASTWTAGVDFAPSMVDGLKLSLTYYAIDYDNRIMVPSANSLPEILLQESQWSSVIHRGPTQDEVHAACSGTPLFGVTLSQCESAPIAAIVDFRVRNMASTRVRGIDLKVDQTLRTRFGRFDLGLNGGYVLNFLQASSSTSPTTNVVNTVGNPLAFRMRGTVDWSQRDFDDSGFGVSASLDRLGGYRDPDSAVAYGVAPFTTLDLRFSYRTPMGSGALDGLEFGLNASNVFNNAPPFVDDESGYDIVNADPYGRVISLNVQKSW